MDEAACPTVPDVARPIARASLVANGAGAVLDYLYLQFLAPGGFDLHGATTRGTIVFIISAALLPLYLAVAFAVVARHMRRRVAEWSAVLTAGGELSPASRRAALGLLPELTLLTGIGWGGAALLYGVLNVIGGQPAADDLRLVAGILLGGVVTSALTYLLAERRFRPVLVLALAGRPEDRPGVGLRGRLLFAWAAGSGLPLAAVGLMPFERHRGGLVSLPVSIGSLAAIGLVAGYLLIRATADSIAGPLAAVRRGLEAVGRGDLSVVVPVDDAGEIGRLQAGVNHMVQGLRERRRLEELFGRHVGEAVARRALTEEAVLGGQVRQVSVLFVDLVGSTALAASRPPDEVVTVLNRLFGFVVDAVGAEGGWVNKFQGDAALCVFGAPDAHGDHATRALRAARALQSLLAGARAADPGPLLDAGIGVAGGPVVAGNVGALDRYEYTVIGDPVNEAARLSELAKSSPGRLLASGTVVIGADDVERSCWRDAGEVVLRGRGGPTTLMEPLPIPAGPGRHGALVDAPEVSLAQPPATAGTIEIV